MATGTGQIVATAGGLADTTGNITVTPGVAQTLVISPDSAIVSADSTLQFTVAAFDGLGFATDSGTITWSVTGGIGSVDASGLFDATTASVGRIIAESNLGPVDTSVYLEVTPGEIVSLVISPDSAVVGLGDSLQFTASGLDSDANSAAIGDLTWSAMGRSGYITDSGLFVATRPGAARVTASSSINGTADTSDVVTVEELFLTTIPLGNAVVLPGESFVPVHAFRLENFYNETKSVTGIAVNSDFRGPGVESERFGNVDSVMVYRDADHDSLLTPTDSLLAAAAFDAGSVSLSFAAVNIESDSACSFIVGLRIADQPHDGDTLDTYVVPATDISTSDGTIVVGADTSNSIGRLIINGMTASQLVLTPSGVDEIAPSDSLEHVATISIPRNGYATDVLSRVTVAVDGTAGPGDIDSLLLYQDTSGDGWTGAANEARIGRLVYTGDLWMLSGLSVPLTQISTDFLLVAKVAAYPDDGATLAPYIPLDGIQVVSGNDGPLDGPVGPVDTIVIRSQEELTVSAIPIPARSLIPGANSGALLAISLTNGYAGATDIDSITLSLAHVSPFGATIGQLDSQIDSLLVYLNRDGNPAEIGATDTLVASVVPTGGSATVDFSGLTIGGGGETITLLFAAQLGLYTARDGNTIGLRLDDSTAIHTSPATAIVGTFPLANSTPFVISAFPATAVVTQELSGGVLYGGQSRIPIMSFSLPRDGYASAVLSSITVRNSGSLDDAYALRGVELYRDLTGNGLTNDDPRVSGLTYGAGNWFATGLAAALTDTLTPFILTVDIANLQFDGGSLDFRIPVGGIIYQSGTAGPDDTPVLDPESHLAFPSDRITVISVPAISSPIAPGSMDVPILTFALYNGYSSETQTLSSLELTNISRTRSTTAFVDGELGQVSLFFDENASRTHDGDPLIAVGSFSDQSLRMTGLDIVLPPESLSYFFVEANLPLNVVDSDSLAVSINGPADLSFAASVNINGDLPLTSGGYMVVNGSVAEQYGTPAVISRTLRPNDSDVTVFSVRPARNGDRPDTLRSLRIENTGDAVGSDFSSLALWADANDDGVWQGTDLSLGSMVYAGGRWERTGMNLEILTDPPVLFVIAAVSAGATPGAEFHAVIPLNGCEYASGNDGPIDVPVDGEIGFTISNSGLRLDFADIQSEYTVGQTIGVRITATNLQTVAMDSVTASVMSLTNPSAVTFDSSSIGPVNLAAGSSADFTFFYTAVGPGDVSWRVGAFDLVSADSSAIIQSETVTIQSAPSPALVTLINSMPNAVTRGQANVFPLSIVLRHGDLTSSVAPIRLDSLRLTTLDEMGAPQVASAVFERMLLVPSLDNVAIVQPVPDLADIQLAFAQPLMIQPASEVALSMLVTISPTATATRFALAITGATAIPLLDVNTLQPVALDPGLTFPQTSAICRIDNPSAQMAVASTPLLGTAVNRGQTDAPVVQINLRHPGAAGSSQIQLSKVTCRFRNGSGSAVMPQVLFREIKLMRQSSVVASLSDFDADTTVEISLNAPLTLSPGEVDSLRLVVSPIESPGEDGFSFSVPDSLSLSVRDLTSGSVLPAVTDTMLLATGSAFPMLSNWCEFLQPSLSPEVCLTSMLPTSVAGGADSLSLVEVSIAYPVLADVSGLLVRHIALGVYDSTGVPLDPGRLFDRVGIVRPDGMPVYQSFVQLIEGAVLFSCDSANVILSPGDSVSIVLLADLEGDVPYDNFMLRINGVSGLAITDATDSTHSPEVVLQTGCAADLLFESPPASVFLPAGRPLLDADLTDVRLVYPGARQVSVFPIQLAYESLTSEGDLLLHGMTGRILQRTTGGYVSVAGASVFSSVAMTVDEDIVAADSSLGGDSLMLATGDGVVMHRGSEFAVDVICDIRADAPLGNYVIEFGDSTFLECSDRNLATVRYPVLRDVVMPVRSVELSVTATGLEASFTNYPNPFMPSEGPTTIGYVLSEDARVDIEMFTVTGERIADIGVDVFRGAGAHDQDTWLGINDAGRDVVPGTYFCRITARYVSGRTESYRRKISVIR